MRKIKYLFFIFLFFNSINVYAADCTKYGCATCDYAVNDFIMTYKIESNGSKPVSVSVSNNHKDGPYDSVQITDGVSPKIFVSDSTNKIVCPSILNYTISADRNGKISYKFFSDPNTTSKAIVKLQDSKNNDKTVTELNNKTKSCTYDGKMITGGSSGPKLTIETDGIDNIGFNFIPNTWKLNTIVSDIDANYFKNFIEIPGCPDIYVNCSSSGNDKYCSVTKDNLMVTPQNPSESVEDNDADKTENLNNNILNFPKPSIKVDINISDNGCGVLGNDLSKWLQWALDVLRIVGLVLTIVLAIYDYLSATFSPNEEGMSKANKNFSTRLLNLGLLFLVPTIIEFSLTLLNISVTSNDPSCGLK